MQYRIPLEGGDTLVLTLEIEEREEADASDPASIGTALLAALGLGRPSRSAQGKPIKNIKRPVEEDPDAWLARTSKDALKGMK